VCWIKLTTLSFFQSTLNQTVAIGVTGCIATIVTELSKAYRPTSDSDGGDEVSGVSLLLTREDRLLISVLIDLGLEIDVCIVDDNVRVKLRRRVPSTGEVTREVAARLHQVNSVHRCTAKKWTVEDHAKCCMKTDRQKKNGLETVYKVNTQSYINQHSVVRKHFKKIYILE